MSQIKEILSREILDSRGNPTVETEVFLESGAHGRAAVASGASTGANEAQELRDGNKKRYRGLGVRKAVENVEEKLFPELEGMDACDQLAIDQMMIALDGTPTKEKLGANAILSVSMAVAHAAADELALPLYRYLGGIGSRVLPIPMFNVINGGRHSDAPTAFQEFMIRPVGAESFSEAMEMGSAVYCSLKKLLKSKGFFTAVGDEGGFAPQIKGGAEAILDMLMTAISEAGLQPQTDISLAVDCAASEFYDGKDYDYSIFEEPNSPRLSSEKQIEYLERLVANYPLESIEDGMAENDWEGWTMLTERIGSRCQLIGDDLFATNVGLLSDGASRGAANAILIKPNQIGTLSETFETITMARQLGYLPVISHRSGETEDTTIADIAVAVNAGQIKAGGLARVDRLAKYNQLLRIEDELGNSALYGF